jgi:fermentation-respiration switch protein FrsA (DUF1100 family)
MAPSAESFAQALSRQTHYLLSIGMASPTAALDADAFVRQITDPKLTPDTTFNSPLAGGTTGAYFLDLRNYNAVATAKALARPLLLLQGERDYQVTIADDLNVWIAGLRGKQDVTVIRYPNANHAFVDGTGAPSPRDYSTPGHVDRKVIADIAAWTNAH